MLVKISTSAVNLPYYVDGQVYWSAAVFQWSPGSSHTLGADPMNNRIQPNTQYLFKTWTAAGAAVGGGTVISVVADPAVTAYQAVYDTQFKLTLRFFNCSAGGPCNAPGTIYIGTAPHASDTEIWLDTGSTVVLRAEASPGYVFAGWAADAGNFLQGLTDTVTMRGPVFVYPHFEMARRVTVLSDPPGLQILADRTAVATPANLDWAWGSTHSLAPVTPQTDARGKYWVFHGWSDQGATVRAYQVQPGGYTDSLTAIYVPGAAATFLTNPPRLKLSIDGRENWYSYNFIWGLGETHHIEAPARQTDAQGRVYVFRAWSNGSTQPSVDLALADDAVAQGVRMTATYELLGRALIQSNVGGVTVTADGVDCPLPCTLDRQSGGEVKLSAPVSLAAGDGMRYDFRGWSDGVTTASRAVAFSTDAKAIGADYALMTRLTTLSDPPGGAVWRSDPPSPDGYFDSTAVVAVTAEAKPGYRFRRIEGDASSAFSSVILKMTVPRTLRAILDQTPYVAPAGVRNGAGDTPQAAVAPGSIISIFGASLAPGPEVGPDSPLAQTLASVTVRLGDRLLPLFYVSPEQINAQLPSDVEPGQQTLVVKWEGKPEVQADFTVARNAPGLFQFAVEDQLYAIAVHGDGSLVTPAAPAAPGETLTLFGTGFGPCDRQPPDGFAVPGAPVFNLLDRLELVAGDTAFDPLWTGAAPARVGIQVVRFKIGDNLPAGVPLSLRVRINGVESNSVTIPVE